MVCVEDEACPELCKQSHTGGVKISRVLLGANTPVFLSLEKATHGSVGEQRICSAAI